MAKTAKCRECGLEIMYLHTRHGKRMPVDPYPDENGNIAARPYPGAYVDAHMVSDRTPPAGYRLFMPHRATCQAVRSRRRAAKRAAAGSAPALFGGDGQ